MRRSSHTGNNSFFVPVFSGACFHPLPAIHAGMVSPAPACRKLLLSQAGIFPRHPAVPGGCRTPGWITGTMQVIIPEERPGNPGMVNAEAGKSPETGMTGFRILRQRQRGPAPEEKPRTVTYRGAYHPEGKRTSGIALVIGAHPPEPTFTAVHTERTILFTINMVLSEKNTAVMGPVIRAEGDNGGYELRHFFGLFNSDDCEITPEWFKKNRIFLRVVVCKMQSLPQVAARGILPGKSRPEKKNGIRE
jgi:hypothetical protein